MYKIKNHIEEKFDFNVECKEENNHILLRVGGVDNTSLSKWIGQEFDHVDVKIKNKKSNKFSDNEWIIVENK